MGHFGSYSPANTVLRDTSVGSLKWFISYANDSIHSGLLKGVDVIVCSSRAKRKLMKCKRTDDRKI
ncbi:MAG: hypothetical protein ACTS4V_01575 [Candidatus Hodgkinia cicadicola]